MTAELRRIVAIETLTQACEETESPQQRYIHRNMLVHATAYLCPDVLADDCLWERLPRQVNQDTCIAVSDAVARVLADPTNRKLEMVVNTWLKRISHRTYGDVVRHIPVLLTNLLHEGANQD